MRVFEVTQQSQQQTNPKRSMDKRTDWERNAAKLRSREAKLNAKSPISPVEHRP